MTHFVEATNCHHHFLWQSTHASEGDAVYMDEEEMGASDHDYHHDVVQNEHDSDDFYVESDDSSGVEHDDGNEHVVDNSKYDTEYLFDQHNYDRSGGGGGSGGAMILPSTGRMER